MTIDALSAGRPEIAAALVLLSKLGLTAADLLAGAQSNQLTVPTFAEFVPQVAAAVTPGTLKAYGTYWNRVVDAWGVRRINEPTPLEIEKLGKQIRANRIVRRNGRGGSGAEENYVAAMRCLYKRAVANGIITETGNPAAKVAKPRRLPSLRHALQDKRLAEITQVVATTGNDPALDSLLLRFHTETACRRGGALNLRRCDLDERQCLVRLREKGGTERWQPVSPTLMRYLLAHWDERGEAANTGKIFRFRNGRPVTYRRYDHLWARIGKHLPWVITQNISAHWLRHTVVTWVERTFSYAIARAFAGHNESSGDVGSTATYVKADICELAAVVAVLTGEPHPLAPQEEAD